MNVQIRNENIQPLSLTSYHMLSIYRQLDSSLRALIMCRQNVRPQL